MNESTGSGNRMEFERTQSLSDATRPLYRCPCGNDLEIDPEKGGMCSKCQRVVPASVTLSPLSLTRTMSSLGDHPTPAEHSADDQDEFIGMKLGHFEVIEPLGKGGMGHVYRALDTSLQRYVAVKVIQGSSNRELDAAGQQRLMHEAIAQARVNHPNIVTIYFVGRENHIPFLAMELIDGYDIAELIQQGEIPYETLCWTAIRITNALDTAGQMGIVHGDIKPQNLMMVSNGNVKLSDFGMATLEEADQTGTIGGTPNYLAPELLTGGSPSMQSDMYALGVTLFEMTFGRLPIQLSGTTLGHWSAIHSSAEISFPEPWPDHLPDRWKTVLTKLLHKDPGQRYGSYEELGQQLRAILPGPRVAARVVPRAVAFAIDFATVVLLAVPILLLVQALQVFIPTGNLGNLFLAPSLVIYTAVVYWWRQSLGRELMHVKVVNQYGLVPTRQNMLLRSLLRMAVIWCVPIGVLLGVVIPLAEFLVPALGLLFLACDAIYGLMFRGSSLHDRIMGTQAIVGSDTH
ncbi:MAG: protein kinase domain-containing protein [Pirellulaceae bacterium]